MSTISTVLNKIIVFLKILTVCAFICSLLYLIQNAPFTEHIERVFINKTDFTRSEKIVYMPVYQETTSDYTVPESNKFAQVTTYEFHHKLFYSQLILILLIFSAIYFALHLLNRLMSVPTLKPSNERSFI